MKRIATVLILVACKPEEAGEAIERTGEELGEVAQKGAEHVDDLAAQLDAARDKLAKAKELADRAGEAYMDPGEQSASGGEADTIRCSGERYAIDRETVERAIANPMQLARGTSFEPVAGKGYRLTRVDPESAIAELDVRAGDILVDVDGTNVNALDGTLFVSRLRQASEISFTLERAGQSVTKTVAIEG